MMEETRQVQHDGDRDVPRHSQLAPTENALKPPGSQPASGISVGIFLLSVVNPRPDYAYLNRWKVSGEKL